MRLPIYFLLLSVLLYSCKGDKSKHSSALPFDNPTEAEAKLYASCIAIHDEVMPRMGELTQLRTQLKEIKSAIPDAIENEDQLKLINGRLSDLNKAENMMFDWMARFAEVKNLERAKVDPELYSLERSAQDMKTFFEQSISKATDTKAQF